jgi:carbamate kinase
MGKLAVLAIGGNSLIKNKERQKVEDQHQAIKETLRPVANLIVQGWQVLISHGNGPQVGFIMRRSEVAHQVTGLHMVPMVNCVADTQGSIGYQIQQSLNNKLANRGQKGQCVTVVTMVVVDKNDPGFKNPSKPVGSFFDDEQAAKTREEFPHWSLKEDAGRGWRRVVPSPEPKEIVEKKIIMDLLQKGYHLVAVGGGGIPVVRTPTGYQGVDAVIDKDLATSLLAWQIKADLMIISTAVERVALNFGKPDQEDIAHMTVAQAEQYISQGHFAPGSMLPKIQAAINYLKNGGKEVIITSPEYIKEAVTQGKGTHIVP